MKKNLMALLLGTVIAVTPVRSYAIDAKTQSAIFYAMSGASLILDLTTMILEGFDFHLGFDIPNLAVDVVEFIASRKRRTTWKGLPDKLKANQRLIGSFEDLESYQESQQYLTETDVHAMALTTTGIEALFDDGNINTEVLQPAVVTSAEMTAAIHEQFGTPELDDATTTDSTDSTGSTGGENTGTESTVDPNDTAAMQEKLREGYAEETLILQRKRRVINKQKVSLTGVAKAELLQSACATDNSKKRLQQLESFVGGGESLLGQVKILAGLELELGGRLNLLDAAQSNTLAVDAANALVHVK